MIRIAVQGNLIVRVSTYLAVYGYSARIYGLRAGGFPVQGPGNWELALDLCQIFLAPSGQSQVS